MNATSGIPVKYGHRPIETQEDWAVEILAKLLNEWLVVGNCVDGIEALECVRIECADDDTEIVARIQEGREGLQRQLLQAVYLFRDEVRAACLAGVRAKLFVFEDDKSRDPPVGTHSRYPDKRLSEWGGSLLKEES